MRPQEWKRERKRGHIRRLGPYALLAFLFGFLLLSVLPVPDPAPEEPSRHRVGFRTMSQKQWMRNKARTPAPEKLAEKKEEPKKEEKKPEEEKKPDKPDGRIVDIAMPEKQERPEDARFVSQYDSKTQKETKARIRLPAETVTKRFKPRGLKRPSQPIGESEDRIVLKSESRPEKPGTRIRENLFLVPRKERRMKLALLEDPAAGLFRNRKEEKESLKGNNRDRMEMVMKEEGEDGRPGDDGRDPRTNIPKNLLPDFSTAIEISGAPMTDYLPEVEEDEETGLNTKAFKYATYFNRIKRKVANRWSPVEAQRRFDPTYAIFGYRSRYTQLYITLDDNGRLVSAEVKRSSGVDFLDQEALAAFHRAQPFPNPPMGVLETDRTVKFPFGFFFEMTKSGFRVTGYR